MCTFLCIVYTIKKSFHFRLKDTNCTFHFTIPILPANGKSLGFSSCQQRQRRRWRLVSGFSRNRYPTELRVAAGSSFSLTKTLTISMFLKMSLKVPLCCSVMSTLLDTSEKKYLLVNLIEGKLKTTVT